MAVPWQIQSSFISLQLPVTYEKPMKQLLQLFCDWICKLELQFHTNYCMSFTETHLLPFVNENHHLTVILKADIQTSLYFINLTMFLFLHRSEQKFSRHIFQ